VAEATATVSRKGEARLRRGHPWIFRSDITRADDAGPGSVVRVLSSQNRPLGLAFFSNRSEITLRMISRGESLPASFLHDRVAAAIQWRETVAAGASACRLVHGEGDGLPSLVVDRYGDHLVVQTLSQATDRLKAEIVSALQDLLHPAGVLERNDPRVRALEGLDRKVGDPGRGRPGSRWTS
jgi:23S rRNA (cytosine1962-C5)-methyltransferase